MTEHEVSEYLRIPEGTLRNWRSTQPERLPALKQGRMIRYARSTVESFFANEKPGAGTPGEDTNA
ncbi:helix-turn-helix domain-containing protein [Leucobacter sp. NPDC077196]|uniref:helix-turn-helix domain-containing protein n=1 Tax=Leucobacter sp. NPDC077196 TaxID=3154959 RepID=UPI003413DA31